MNDDTGLVGRALSALPELGLTLLLVGMLIALYALIRARTRADRAVAFDLIGLLVVGFLGVLSIAHEQRAYVDIAIVVVVTNFLVTVAIARFLLKTGQR